MTAETVKDRIRHITEYKVFLDFKGIEYYIQLNYIKKEATMHSIVCG